MPKITVYSKQDEASWARLLERIRGAHRTSPYDLVSIEARPDSDVFYFFDDFWCAKGVKLISNIPDASEAEREVIETIYRHRAINAAHVLGGVPAAERKQKDSLLITLAEEYGFEAELIRL